MSRVRCLIAGVQKAGTTTLFAHLADHPGIAVPDRKELHFFDDDIIDWRRPAYDALEAAFPPYDGRMRLEATPITLFWPGALARVRRYNPDMRLILVFRDPVARAFSHWRMERARGCEARSFSEAIRAEPVGRFGLFHHSYVGRGLYGRQVRRALALFGREQLLFATFEQLCADPAALLARVAAFLDIAPVAPVPPRHENAGVARGTVSPGDVAYLRARFGDDLGLFAQLSGLDIGAWGGARAADHETSAPSGQRHRLPSLTARRLLAAPSAT